MERILKISMTNEQNYLNEARIIVMDAESEIKEKALDFNIFDMLGVGEKEVMMCRVLYEFLNPKGKHGRGGEYLGLFLKDVLGLPDVSEDELDKTKVYREYVIKGTDRRIDIYIDSPFRAIPVEVKIYAEEQKNQCLDYYLFAVDENKKKIEKRKWGLAYLTLFGHMPSEYSTGKGKGFEESIINISWSEDVLGWMRKIRKSQSVNTNVREIIEQYISVLETITNQRKGLVYEKMEENGLLSGRDNMKAAQAISESFAQRKTFLIEKLFDEVKKKIDEDAEMKNAFMDPWNYRGLIKSFYQYQKSSLPGLNYRMREFFMDDENDKYQLWLRFEIDYKPFVSFIIVREQVDKKGVTQYDGEFEKKEEIYRKAEGFIKKNDTDEYHRNGWWVDWFYVPSFDTEPQNDILPDFKNCNDAYYDLFEDGKLKELVDAAVRGIRKMKERISD